MGQETIFITMCNSKGGYAALNVLNDSLRRFGGEMSHSRMIVFDPAPGRLQVKVAHNIEMRPLIIPSRIREYLFAAKVTALAQSEKMARDGYRMITWIDPECLILNPPLLYILNENTDAAFRPVHIQNVGLRVEDPLDSYWKRIYKTCGVDDVDMTVESFVDGQLLRAYFNTHIFSINPAVGLMDQWLDIFTKLVVDREFQVNCCRDDRHRIFLIQAILSTLLVRELESERIRILPSLYNYPYNLQTSIPAEKRISSIGNLVSLTYEGRSIIPAEITDIDISQPYLEFLTQLI